MANNGIKEIKVSNTNYLIEPTLLGTCGTAATTAIKDVTLANFELFDNVQIAVKFTTTNTAAVSGLKLRVNSSNANDAKPIKYRGGNLPAASILTANHIYNFVYDGTNWELVGDLDTDTHMYHKSGSWSGLTYTATAVNNADELKFTIPDNYGDTKNPYASKTKNYVLAAPSSANGVPSFRALVAADIPDIGETYLKLTGGTMTGGINLVGSQSSAYNDKGLIFTKGSRIGENTSGGLGIYAAERIYLRPDSPTSSSSDGIEISGSGVIPSNNNTETLGDSSHKWSDVYATNLHGNLNVTAHTNTTNGNKNYYPWFSTATSGNLGAHAHAGIYIYETVASNKITQLDFCMGSTSITGSFTAWNNGKWGNIKPAALTANRNYTLPNQAGTFALLTQTDANALINLLDTGASDLTSNDYVITQYVDGGTTTKTYHRRPASKVVNATLVKAALGTDTSTTTQWLNKKGLWSTPTAADVGAITKLSSSTDNAIVRFDGTSGAIQNSGVTIDDDNIITANASGHSLSDIRFYTHIATAGKTHVGWVKFAKIDLNDSNHFGQVICDIFISRSYNSPSPETYNIRVMVGWLTPVIYQLGSAVGGHIIDQFRVVQDTTNHEAYFEYHVKETASSSNTVYIKVIKYSGSALVFLNEVQSEEDSAFSRKSSINLTSGAIVLGSGTITATEYSGNAATSTAAETLANKILTATTIDSTAGSYAFSIASTTDMTQITTSSADYVGLQIGNSKDKWQLTASGNHLYFRQNDSGGTNTSWNDWIKILDSSTTAASTNNEATLDWNTTYTIAKINNTDIKFTTMTKPTYAFGDLTTHPTTLSGYGITDAKITSGTITLGSNTISPVTAITWDSNNKKLTNTVNGSVTDVVTADTLRTALGLSNALHFIGVTSTSLSDGSTTSTLTAKSTGSLIKTTDFVDGDIVMDGDQLREYVWSGSAWRLLGITTSTAYSETTSGNTFISSISQGTDGKITADSRALDTSGTWSGTASKATTAADTSSTLYIVGVASGAITTLKHDTSVTVKGGAVSATTYNALTLTAATTGFTIAGGSTTSKTLTINESVTLRAGSSTYLAYYNGDNTLQSHSLAHFSDEFGSSVKDKKNELVLGNGTGKASNGSSWGQLALYSSGTKGTYLKTEENSTDWYTATLPAKTGTIAYTSDVTASRIEIIRLTS